jgi:hypothetical protein
MSKQKSDDSAFGVATGSAPLFIPLKREYFEAFTNGTKQAEFRPYGQRWNERTCWIGRAVVLSLGYGKAHRLRGEIVGFVRDQNPQQLPGWRECYGEKHPEAACIGIAIQQNVPDEPRLRGKKDSL